MTTGRTALNALSERIIACAFTVSNTLRTRYLEKIYENALAHEPRKAGLEVAQQHPINVLYDGEIAGSFSAGLLVRNTVLVGLNAAKALDPIHTAQCLNYLAATALRLCLLFNFGNPRIDIKRLVNGLKRRSILPYAPYAVMVTYPFQTPQAASAGRTKGFPKALRRSPPKR